MKLPHPFSYAVSDAGLPRTLCLGEACGQEAIRGLGASEVARAYWMLRGLDIAIALRVGDDLTGIQRLIQVPQAPHTRLIDFPDVTYSEEIGSLALDCDLALADFTIEQPGRFAWPIRLSMEDWSLGICIGTQLPYWAEVAATKLVAMGPYTLELSLGHAQGLSAPLTIEQLIVRPQFYFYS